jgi:hypothetical protein
LTTRAPRSERLLLGGLSMLSGVSLLLAPERMASMYGLPRRAWLARALGVRDVAIGVELCIESRAAGASLLRALSDTFDAGLIAAEGLRHAERAREAGLRASGVVLLATYARLLHERLHAAASPEGSVAHDQPLQ